MDDIILASNDLNSIFEMKFLPDKKFKFKDLGVLKYFLRLEAARSTKGIITLCQRKCTFESLQDSRLLASRQQIFVMEQNVKLSQTDDELLENLSCVLKINWKAYLLENIKVRYILLNKNLKSIYEEAYTTSFKCCA